MWHAEIIIRRDQIATLGNDLTSKDYLWAIKVKVKHKLTTQSSEKRHSVGIVCVIYFDGQIFSDLLKRVTYDCNYFLHIFLQTFGGNINPCRRMCLMRKKLI